jgi:hypothetical protein
MSMMLDIWDRQGINRQFLGLKDILPAISSRAMGTEWTVGDYIQADGLQWFEADDALRAIAEAGRWVSNDQLAAIAESAPFAVWAVFRGRDRTSASEPWITLSAIDNTFWRIATDDTETHRLIRAAFQDVREVEV